MVLLVPSGACENRPLSALRVGNSSEELRQTAIVHSRRPTRKRIESVQQSQGKHTVTPTGDYHAPRAIRGQVRGMRIGTMLSETRLAKKPTGVPKCEANRRKSVGLALPHGPRKLKTYLQITETLRFL